jgi:glycosyltransferase involved in cell wall biosynthesis
MVLTSKSDSGLPRFTIITSTLNCAIALRKTAASMRSQVYPNIQWVVADGASTDGTVDVIRENLDIVSNWFSAPDRGIYDAWNKACTFIDGEWVLFLGAGDTFFNETTLDTCSISIRNVPTKFHFAFGGLIVAYGKKCVEVVTKGEFKPLFMDLNYSTPPHSATFCRSSILKRNPFDTAFRIIGDKKFMLSYSNGNYYNLQNFITIMDGFGISHDVKSIPLIWRENRMISKVGPKPPFFHKIKAFIINYKNILILVLFGEKRYAKWFNRH